MWINSVRIHWKWNLEFSQFKIEKLYISCGIVYIPVDLIFFPSLGFWLPILPFLLFSILVCSYFLVLLSKCGCPFFRRAKVERTTTSTVELLYVAAIVLSNTAGKWTVYGGVTVTLEPSRARGVRQRLNWTPDKMQVEKFVQVLVKWRKMFWTTFGWTTIDRVRSRSWIVVLINGIVSEFSHTYSDLLLFW